MNTRRVAYLFTSSRDALVSRVQKGNDADTGLRGMNHICGAEYLTARPGSLRSMLLIPRLLTYEFVIAQDSLFLGYVVSVCARLLGRKTKWLYLTMTSSVLIRRHAAHPMRLFLLKKFWTSYFRIVCLSSEQLGDLVRLGIPRGHLVFVPFGVDAHFLHYAGSVHEEDSIVSVGRDAGRDYDTLFKAAERIVHPWVVVTTHENIPAGTNIPSNVSVLYDRPFIEVRDLYARARLVVVASKDARVPNGSDCSGQTVVLDALAAGKAVIATCRPWIADYFIPDQDLIVVPPNDPEALAQAIDSLWRDDERRERLAASGHEKTIANYSTETFAKALIVLMDSAGRAV